VSETIEIRPAVEADAELLAPRLRIQDRDEIYAVTGLEPLAVLRDGVTNSDPCFAVMDAHGLLLALFGAIPNERGRGKVWLLGAPELMRRRFAVARLSREWLGVLHSRYATLWNYVDERNQAHIRWLKWCGFEFTRREEEFGFEHRPFSLFERSVH
jgi:ribosomal protein S18 acetylase RimI-like enzyme